MSTGQARLHFTVLKRSDAVDIERFPRGFEIPLTAWLDWNKENVPCVGFQLFAPSVLIFAHLYHDASKHSMRQLKLACFGRRCSGLVCHNDGWQGVVVFVGLGVFACMLVDNRLQSNQFTETSTCPAFQ